MSDNTDQESEGANKAKGSEEKKQRRFDLKIIFIIIIISLSCVFGILIFRNVKKVIQNPPHYEMKENNSKILEKRKGMNAEQRREHFAKHRGAIAKAAREERLELKGRPLIPRPTKKFPSRELPVVINLDSLKLVPIEKEKGLRTSHQEVSNIVAINKSYADQFDPADIYDEKLGRIFVDRDKAQNIEADKVSYNLRTKQLGVITGKLFLKFSSRESFENRQQIYPRDFQEQRVFEATNLVILSTEKEFSLNDLLVLERELSKVAELKRVRVEVLEQGKLAN